MGIREDTNKLLKKFSFLTFNTEDIVLNRLFDCWQGHSKLLSWKTDLTNLCNQWKYFVLLLFLSELSQKVHTYNQLLFAHKMCQYLI